MNMKKVAVFFGGQSFEHDVSIITGLQILQVIDITKYIPIPVYVDLDGNWWTGKDLLDMKNYPLDELTKSKLFHISLNLNRTSETASFNVLNSKLFGKKKIDFDVAFLAFHGNFGENGPMQALFELANVPYTGADVNSSVIYMNKSATKSICKTLNINVLDELIINKPNLSENFDIKDLTKNIDIKFPSFVKPANLGSSIGIAKVTNYDELQSALLNVFKLDTKAIIEPFVENLIEYNIAVMKNLDDKIITSVIESPINKSEFLNFSDKYLSKDSTKKTGPIKLAVPNDGLLSMGRQYNPDISNDMKSFIENSVIKLFEYMGATGNPRIDFLCNSKTNEIWLNEVNPIPGAFAFYLWEKSNYKINYSKLVDIIIQNALKNFNIKQINLDLKSSASVIFKK